jgi:iron complex outermembrane receptor protein
MWSSRRPTCACCLTLALSLGLAARTGAAQSPQTPVDSPAVRESAVSQKEGRQQVPAQRFEGEITVREKEESSLTAPGPEQAARALAEVPGGTSVVDAEQYKRGRASTLQDALGLTPGVYVQPRFGAEEARLSIRGSGLQRTFHGRGLKLLQDGVPLNLADGSFDFQAVEPLTASHIEVLRGGNGLEYGAATLGGAINYESLTGFLAAPGQARIEGGAFGYLRGQASAGWAGDRFDGYASLSHFSQDGFREHSEQSNQRFFGNLGYRFDAGRETRFYLTAVRTDSELPGNLTRVQLRDDPRQAAAGNVLLDQKRDFDLFRLANRTSLRLGGDSRLDLGVFWAAKDLDHPIFQVLDQRSNDVGGDVRYESDRSVGGRRNRLVIGFSPVFGVVDDERFRNVLGRRGDRTARGRTESLNFDLYAENRYYLRPQLALTAGFQASYAGRDFADRFLADGDQTDDQSFSGFSPKLGLLWEASSGVVFFANAVRSFEPPSFGELVNVGGNGLLHLDPQRATSVEIGSRGTAGPAVWDLVLYRSRIEGELLSLNDAQGNPLGTINGGRTLHAGLEAGLDLRWRAGDAGDLAWRQVYNWSRFRFDGDRAFGDNQLAGLPEHFYRAELLFEHRGGWYGGPGVEWVPDRYPVDHANTLFADAYTLLNAKVGYRTAWGWSGFVEARNLTDETYAATTGVIADARGLDSAQFLPGDGRSVFAGIEYRLGRDRR